jgi:uncharacterized membrane protein (DUF2068 family)
LTGSQEVDSSILFSSTNKFKGVRQIAYPFFFTGFPAESSYPGIHGKFFVSNRNLDMNGQRTNKSPGVKLHSRGLHVVALFEGTKGLLVLLVGFELLTFIHKDFHEAALKLVEHIHLNPASHYPRIFLDLTERINDTKLWSMAIAAAMYSLVRMIEAVGLWLGKRWAEWFAILTGSIYIPVEIFEVVRSLTWPMITVLIVNIAVVSYLLFVLIRNGGKGAAR